MTPMMAQYFDIKKQYPDFLLFYRMGDFYELFFEDAVESASILNIALTKRGKHNDEDIPMCGVPHHSYVFYLNKLIKAGKKIAVCEQMESPLEAKKRGYKEVVRREVVRIITPGTITEETLLEAKQNNFLMSVTLVKEQCAIAWLDITTGEIYSMNSKPEFIGSDISRIMPREIIIPELLLDNDIIRNAIRESGIHMTIQANNIFNYNHALHNLKSYYELSTTEGLGNFSPTESIALSVLINYAKITQKNDNKHILLPKSLNINSFMRIDTSTQRNLEFFVRLNSEYIGSLLSIIDNTQTASGGRLLRQYFSHPLIDLESINKRQIMVEYFYNNNEIHEKVLFILKEISDIERIVGRIKMQRCGPRDLVQLRDSLEIIDELRILLQETDNLPDTIKNMVIRNYQHNTIVTELKKALEDVVPIVVNEGRFIKAGYDPALDTLKQGYQNAINAKDQLQASYRQSTGIATLRLEDNQLLGLFVEVTAQQSKKINNDDFILKQTLTNVVRYTTSKLQDIEQILRSSANKALARELTIFEEICHQILKHSNDLYLLAEFVALIDVIACFAYIAKTNNYVRPKMTEEKTLDIKGGRHPVIEHCSKDKFIPNDLLLNQNEYIWLVTGPNMAGKSTLLRQNALIVFMAQIGCFVPVDSATIGIVDRLFSRIGAGDDLARNQSTFMVEMIETAYILNMATEKSMIILDEVGRGTSTYDGLSIAWACVEYLHNKVKARTLFATHYHELISLQKNLPYLACTCMKAEEWDGKIVFFHKIMKGSIPQSFGIHVAALAGIPNSIIKRSQAILKNIAKKDSIKEEQLPLLNYQTNKPENQKLREKIQNLDIGNTTPIQALEFIHELQNML